MNLSKFFIDRPIFAGVLSLLMLIGGLQRVRPGVEVAPKEVAMDAKPEVTAQRDAAPRS